MVRRRRLPRHLLEPGAQGRRAHAPRRGGVGGPVAEAWLAAVEAVVAPATRTMARRRMATAHTRRVTLVPGSVRAEVRQASYRHHVVTIRVPEVDEAGWDRLLDAASLHAGWLASLAAGVLEDDLAAALVEAGLIPPGESLRSECTCRSEAGLCVHAAVGAHIAATALTVEPAGMLTVRGISADRLRERILRRLPGSRATGIATDPAGMDWNALVLGAQPALPSVPGPPPQPGRPHPLPEPPSTSGLNAADLDDLAADAAARAFALLMGAGDGGLELEADADLARRVAAMDGIAVASLAARTGREVDELRAMAEAWRIAGAPGVAALCRSWRAVPRALEPGLLALEQLSGASASWRLNRVTSADGLVDLALGRDGLWYLLRRERRTAPARLEGPGSVDPMQLLSGRTETAGPEGPAVEQLRLL